jgi:hypothetical protein
MFKILKPYTLAGFEPTTSKLLLWQEDGEERSDGELSSSQVTTTETDATLSPTIR